MIKDLKYKNALHTIEFLEKQLREQDAAFGKYKRCEMACRRIKAVAGWPVDKARETALLVELKKGMLRGGEKPQEEKKSPHSGFINQLSGKNPRGSSRDCFFIKAVEKARYHCFMACRRTVSRTPSACHV